MPASVYKLTRWSHDPQNWIHVIALLTFFGLCFGAFDPVEGSAEPRLAQSLPVIFDPVSDPVSAPAFERVAVMAPGLDPVWNAGLK